MDGTNIKGHVLIVDDNQINRLMLQREVTKQGHKVTTAEDGQEALDLLHANYGAFDVVLLDILMPKLDGFQVLETIKANPDMQHLPVIMISALDELDSVVRCIEMGATDFLTKPFKPAILKARLNSSLTQKQLRDLEIEYLEQVNRVVAAAEAVEGSHYDPDSLNDVALRDDALGGLARVFQRMAEEVHLREQRLKNQLDRLRLDMDEMKKALSEPVSVYLPLDRRFAIYEERELPEWTSGAALFADISGFTPLTEMLAEELGPQQGAEEMTRLLNQVYGALIAKVHEYGGVVIGFSGDAITCWFDGDDGRRATTCGLEMQGAMMPFSEVNITYGLHASLGIKVAVVCGPVRRLLAGDPTIRLLETIAGETLAHLASAEGLANRGEVLIQEAIVAQSPSDFVIGTWRNDPDSGGRFAQVTAMAQPAPTQPWPELPAGALADERCRPWLPGPVYEMIRSGSGLFLADLRPAAALFLKFSGIDYDHDPDAGEKLNSFTRWAQRILDRYEGHQIQLTIGDKGSYVYASFGAPVAHSDDPLRAVYAALELQSPPPELAFIGDVRIGVTQGPIWSGAYGSTNRRTYGAMGERVNVAARLMQAAEGTVLVDEGIFQAVKRRLAFETLPPIKVKGVAEPLAVYRPTGEKIRTKRKRAKLIGRGAEQVRLREAIQLLHNGKSAVLLLEGEGGIGKSRLLEECRLQAEALGVFTMEIVPTANEMDDQDGDGDADFGSEYTAGQWDLKNLDAMVNQLQKMVKNWMTAVFIDNAQEIPPETWEQLVDLARNVQPLLLVVGTGLLPEAVAGAYSQLQRLPFAQQIPLRSLTAAETYLLACDHLEVVALPADLVDALAGAAGNPTVIEELIYSLRDEGYLIVESNRCYIPADVDLKHIVLPATAQGVTISRIDRLSPSEKMVLKVAAVIGTEFNGRLLDYIFPIDADKPYLGSHLAALKDLELIAGGSQPGTYRFTNPLTRETAYNALLFAQRRHLHRQAAEWLEANFASDLAAYADALAEHWQQADEPMKAIRYLEIAGRQARAAGSLVKAEAYLQRSLEIEARQAILSRDYLEEER